MKKANDQNEIKGIALLLKQKDQSIRMLQEKLSSAYEKMRWISISHDRYIQDFFDRYGQSIGNYEYIESRMYYLYNKIDNLRNNQVKVKKQIQSAIDYINNLKHEYSDLEGGKKNILLPREMSIRCDSSLIFLNHISSILNCSISKEEVEFENDLDKSIAKISTKFRGFKSYISEDYNADKLVKLLHPLIDNKKCKEHVPYILILMESGALVSKPSWEKMRDEFKNIGAKSNSNYYKLMGYSLNESAKENSFREKDIKPKRSKIEEILKQCRYPSFENFYRNRTDKTDSVF